MQEPRREIKKPVIIGSWIVTLKKSEVIGAYCLIAFVLFPFLVKATGLIPTVAVVIFFFILLLKYKIRVDEYIKYMNEQESVGKEPTKKDIAYDFDDFIVNDLSELYDKEKMKEKEEKEEKEREKEKKEVQ